MRGEPVGSDEQERAPCAQEALLWSAWRERQDAAARERLIRLHCDFARIIAGRLYARRHTDDVEFEEYLQLARVGLIESVDRFDPHRGASFRTYASHRIQGAILSGLEALTERARQVALKRRIEQERLQSLSDGTDAKGGDAFSRLAVVAVGLAIGLMLEDVALYRAQESACDDAYAACEMRQLCRRLVTLVGELPPRESKIIRCHYFQQIPFDEIARMLGLTKGRISQLHKRGLALLRHALRGPGLDLRL